MSISPGSPLSVSALRAHEDAKLVREIVTPEGVPLRFTLARAGDRAGALVLDMMIAFGALIAIYVAMHFASPDSDSWLPAVLQIVLFLLRNFYFVAFEVRWQGQTPGKRQIGIRVIDARGGQLETSAVLARNLVRELEIWIPLALVFSGGMGMPAAPGWARLLAGAWAFVFLFMPLFNKDRLRVGDMIAGTRVVMQPRPVLVPDLVDEVAPAPRRTAGVSAAGPAPAPAHAFSDAQLGIYGVYELQVLEDVLRIKPGDPAQHDVLRTVSEKVRAKIRYEGNVVDDARFLREFYAAQRAHLEQKLLFGQRRQDKFSR